MADTCIVCLLDLDSVEPPSLSSPPDDSEDSSRSGGPSDRIAPVSVRVKHEPKHNDKDPLYDGDLIAHLPCGHFLHNGCLKPWVERANSCPTCRASFNVVELVAKIGGPVLSTYVVQDKQQVPDVDPNLIIDEDFDIEEAYEEEPCIICEEYGNGPGRMQLLECDACERHCHVFCAGLERRPRGEWFCPNCIENPHALATSRRQSRSSARQRGRRRRAPSHDTNAWARVWQSVWHNLHFDIEYPFDDDEEAAHEFMQEQEEAQRREINEWNRRLRLASRQGAGERFRQTAAAILQRRTPPPAAQPKPESQDELRAWNAFEKAREARDVPSPANRRKRKAKSTSTSPREPQGESHQSERVLKRPRTRRAQDAAGVAGPSTAESSRQTLAINTTRHRSPHAVLRMDHESNDTRPSFLQSLLKEVEVGAKSDGGRPSPANLVPVADLSDHAASPQSSSPGASPTSSNHPTPRPGTPPPLSLTRPSSPPISSTVRPIYPLAPNFSPTSTTSPDGSPISERQPRQKQVHRTHTHQSRSSSPPRSKDASPTRISLTTKSEIQSMVRAALDTLYHQRQVTKDQYTDINRDVSRMLYDRIGEHADGITENGKVREKWQNIAAQEVDVAVKALKEEERSEKKEKEAEKEKEERKEKEKEKEREKPKAPQSPTKARVIVPTPSWPPTVHAGGES